jgi:hypothetical protein
MLILNYSGDIRRMIASKAGLRQKCETPLKKQKTKTKPKKT